jgi:hypothetical protein
MRTSRELLLGSICHCSRILILYKWSTISNEKRIPGY